MTPDQIDILVDKYIIGLYQDMEREVIADISRRVKKTGRYTETAELQAKFMREQGYSTAKIQAEVMKLLRADKDFQMTVAENTKAYKQMVTNLIKDTVHKAKKAGDKLIAAAGMMAFNNDLSMWQIHNVDLKKPNSMSQLMSAFRLQTGDELKNLARSTGFKNTALGTTGVLNAYQREVDLAVLKISTGTFSFDQAVNDCVHRLAQSGLRSVDYASGRSYQLDTAARMAARTGVSQLAGKVTEMNLEATRQDLVITSQHMGSRPEHAPIQNRVFSYSGKNRKYPGFKAPLKNGGAGYGMADGIKGVNCTHNFYPYWEGDYIPPDIEYDETYYQNTQKQRAMERGIRATKREIEAQKAIGGSTKDLTAKLRKQTADYRGFSESVGIRPKDNRLRVASGTSEWKKIGVKKKDDNVVKSTSGVTIEPTKDKRVVDVHRVGKIDREIYKCITDDISTEEVVITDNQIQHINDRHPNDYERFSQYFGDIVENPDYIIKANKPNTAVILKEIEDNGEKFQTVLRLCTSKEPEGYKNSIITFLKIDKKRWERYLRTKEILYKRE